MTPRTALLLGATGLVGGHCLDLLLADDRFERVVTLGRRTAARDHPRLEQHLVDFDTLADFTPHVRGDAIFCCLGTTLRAAGSRDAFRRVDHDYPLAVARAAAERRVPRFLLVSAAGADSHSRFFYSRVKGEVERAIAGLDFPHFVALRPSLLLGERSEPRLGEALAAPLMRLAAPLMIGPLRRYRPVAARDVALAMVELAAQQVAGTRIVDSDEIDRIAAAAERR